MSKTLFVPLQLSLATIACLSASPILAQVTSDGTVNTQVNQNENVAEITGGETRGSNLFHSFQDFSVGAGNEAFFNNANNISDIFSRVTGGNISNINGLIRANGSANLFLINPAGIVFGEGARLDIGGSFYGSSASSILFEDGEFSAVDNLNQPILTINAPIGLSFRDNPGEIINRANFGLTRQTFAEESTVFDRVTDIKGLEVNRGQNFAFIGGNISLEGSGISAPGGNVTLGGLSQAGEITINSDGSFEFPNNVARANVSLTDSALVSVASDGGGSIDIDVATLSLAEQSRLYAGIAEGIGNPNAVAGDIVINASELVQLTGSGQFEDPFKLDLETSILNTIGLSPDRLNGEISTSVGNSGSININTDRLEVNERSFIRNRIYGAGNSGDINIVANDVFLNRGAITNDLNAGGEGNTGEVAIDANSLFLDNSFVLSDNFGTGNAGNVTINIAEDVTLTNLSIVFSQVQSGAEGNAGNVEINARNLQVVDSLILADSRGQGNAGDIILNITNNISLEDNDFRDGASEIVTGIGIASGDVERDGDLVNQGAVGDAGAINIEARNLSISDGSQIFASTNNVGNGGNIDIQLTDALSINRGGQIASQVGERGVGNGGQINITAPSISLDEFSFISTNAETKGIGAAGDIVFNTNDISISNASIVDARTENEFDGGNITVNADTVNFLSGGKIITVSNNTGNSGAITFNVNSNINIAGSDANFDRRLTELSEIEEIAVDDRPAQFRFLISSDILNSLGDSSGLFANTTPNSSGNAGSIQLFTPSEVSLSDRGLISVEANGDGGAGTILIDAQNLNLDRSSLIASTSAGEGGNIDLIIDDTLVLDNNSLIAAQAFNEANGGNLSIDTNFIVAFSTQTAGNGNDIVASAVDGDGGNININAESLLGIQAGEALLGNRTNDIDASSDFGLDGTISIFTPDINPIEAVTELPTNVVEAEQTTAQACANNREVTARNALTIKGKGGIIPDPALPLNSFNITANGEPDSTSAIPAPIETSKGKIQLARGIEVTESGAIRLVAYRTNNAGDRIPEIKPNCDRV